MHVPGDAAAGSQEGPGSSDDSMLQTIFIASKQALCMHVLEELPTVLVRLQVSIQDIRHYRFICWLYGSKLSYKVRVIYTMWCQDKTHKHAASGCGLMQDQV